MLGAFSFLRYPSLEIDPDALEVYDRAKDFIYPMQKSEFGEWSFTTFDGAEFRLSIEAKAQWFKRDSLSVQGDTRHFLGRIENWRLFTFRDTQVC